MWQFVFWVCLAVVGYTYVGYPLFLYLLVRVGKRSHEPAEPVDYPSLCLIVSAFNEEKIIRKKIENSLNLEYPRDRYTVLVASDGSDDDTVSIAREYVESGIKVVEFPVRSGKSAVLSEVTKTLDQDVIVFTDANSLFSDDALVKLVRHFQNPTIGCVVGKLRYVDRHTSSVGKGEGMYWRYEGMLSVLESKLHSVLVANGSIFGIRRETLTELYPEVANDFQIPVEVASQGYGIIYEPEAVAYERLAVFWQEEFQRKVRIILRGLTGFIRMRGKFRGFRLWQFFSHKLLRWTVGPLLFFVLLANVMLMQGSAFFTTLAMVQVAFYVAALNGWRMRKTRRPHPVFYLPFYFTVVNLAAVMAIAKFISGERQVVWEKAESARVSPIGAAVAASSRSRAAVSAEPLPAEVVPQVEKVSKN